MSSAWQPSWSRFVLCFAGALAVLLSTAGDADAARRRVTRGGGGKNKPPAEVKEPPRPVDPKADAKEYARLGNVAYNIGNYDEAALNYEQAYRLVQDPNLLFNVAQSYRLANNPDKALGAYKGFLRTAPRQHQNRAPAEQHVSELEAQRSGGVPQLKDGEAPGPIAKKPPADEFNPFGASATDYGTRRTPEEAEPASPQDASGEFSLRSLEPTVGGDVMIANQNGVDSGPRTTFGAFARGTYKGRGLELGYFRRALFAPNPHYFTSALYFRFTSAPSPASGSRWYVQAGALGQYGDLHAAGGYSWKFLTVGARAEVVGDPSLCGAGVQDNNATYLVPEVMVTLPIFKRLQVRALGNLRHAILASDSCSFHPSLSTLDVMADYMLSDALALTAGIGFYQFFNDSIASPGPWPSDHSSSSGQGHIGFRYAWAEHLALLARYRRIVYSEGVNEVLVGIEVGLGAR